MKLAAALAVAGNLEPRAGVGGFVRKFAVAAAFAMLVALPAASAKGPQPVLGIDGSSTTSARLAWFDPSSLAKLPGRKVPLAGHTWPWAFSPDRSRLAIAGQENAKQLRFVNARTMRVLGQVPLRYAGEVQDLTWVRPDRVLAYVQGYFDGTIVVVNAATRRIERTTSLSDRTAYGAGRFAGGLALLLGKYEGFSPAAVGVIDADGAVRLSSTQTSPLRRSTSTLSPSRITRRALGRWRRQSTGPRGPPAGSATASSRSLVSTTAVTRAAPRSGCASSTRTPGRAVWSIPTSRSSTSETASS